MVTQEDKVHFQLEKSDVQDRVTELVHTRLIECGWREQVRLACRKVISENGDKTPTVDELINKVTGSARGMVPDAVKRELLHELENVLINIDRNNEADALKKGKK